VTSASKSRSRRQVCAALRGEPGREPARPLLCLRCHRESVPVSLLARYLVDTVRTLYFHVATCLHQLVVDNKPVFLT
jgi:hypothetical protein